MADRDEGSMRGESLRSAIELQIVEVLDGCTQLRPERSRHLLLDMVVRWSGVPLQIADYPTARQWFFGLVHACSAEPGGIEVLLAAAVRLRPDPGAATRLMRLQDEWGALETAVEAPAHLWTRLCGELNEITRAESVESFRAVTGGRQALPPPHCANAWHVFLHLAGQNADREGVPPHMIFLERVAHRLTPATGGGVDQWNRRRSYKWGLSAELDRARLARRDHLPAGKAAHLIIQFAPDHAEPERYLMSWWYQWDVRENFFEPGGRHHVHIDEMERRVGDVVRGFEAALADRHDGAVIEFILPFELLGVPVDWWRLETHAYLSEPLAKDYPVMLRSFERLRTRHWHRVWRRRWVELGRERENGSHRVHWSRPAGHDHLVRLDTTLVSDDTLVALVLSEPPGAADCTGTREMEIAMRRGMPVVIWSRHERSPGAFADELRAFLETPGVMELPDRARQLRLDALLLGPGESERHLGRHLALLWDDPDRQPERGSGLSFSMPEGGNGR